MTQKRPSALQKIFARKEPIAKYRSELQAKCSVVGLDLRDKESTQKTAKEISEIIRAWLNKH
ncbi:MAG: hypothetical protein RIR18_1291 [Pseudomonadota bacterium]|jgi:hypothetical protein